MRDKEVIRTLQRLEFEIRRQVGSHVRMVHKDRPEAGVAIGMHAGKDLSEGNVASILSQAGVTKQEFEKARRGK